MIIEQHALWGDEATADRPATYTAYLADPLPAKPDARRPAAIICGGGAFTRIAEHEQEPVALAFLNAGYQAFVLDYVTSSTGEVAYPNPEVDLGRMLSTVRANADAWRVDPAKVCAVGFSAGGFVCASVATSWKDRDFAALVGDRPERIRPDAVVLGYPLLDLRVTRDEQTRDPRIDLRVPKTIASFSISLGPTICKAGAGLYKVVLPIFVAQMYGIDLGFGQVFTCVLISTFMSIATPGIPGGGVATGAVILGMMGLPLDIMGAIAGLYRLIDMGHTTLNVAGGLFGTLIVAKETKMWDASEAFKPALEGETE